MGLFYKGKGESGVNPERYRHCEIISQEPCMESTIANGLFAIWFSTAKAGCGMFCRGFFL